MLRERYCSCVFTPESEQLLGVLENEGLGGEAKEVKKNLSFLCMTSGIQHILYFLLVPGTREDSIPEAAIILGYRSLPSDSPDV